MEEMEEMEETGMVVNEIGESISAHLHLRVSLISTFAVPACWLMSNNHTNTREVCSP